jgi:formylglycine-generating enzyme required for sulfatase activity
MTPEGVADLHGNVREWTASGLGSAPGLPAVLEHPLIAVTRGVGFVSRDYAAPSAARFPYRRDWTADDLGFRCAESAP